MPAKPVAHPALTELAAFARGDLSGGVAAAIANHIAACPSCRQAVGIWLGGTSANQPRG